MVLAGLTLNLVIPYWVKAHDQVIVTITSGSMRPLIEPGDQLVIQKMTPETDIKTGDIVTFSDGTPGSTKLTSHRVIAETEVKDQEGLWIQTQGDANKTPDANLTPESAIVGTVVRQLGPLGRVMQKAQEPVWRLVAFGPALVLLSLAELPALFGRTPKEEDDSSPTPTAATPKVA